MHSHHSHSGDYIRHAKDHLDEIVNKAIEKEFSVYVLTEHMPRMRPQDLYPEESDLTPKKLEKSFDAYYAHARYLQKSRFDKIHLLVGFEADYITRDYIDYIKELRKKYHFDIFVGSIHHAFEIPIDFDLKCWNKALEVAGGKIENLFIEYFDRQYEMITSLKPPVIGHFDLIRLFAPKNKAFLPLSELSTTVWEKAKRNIDFVISYGGTFELNSAAIRKGWKTPYPQADIAKYILKNKGKFVLSDDSHGVAQVGLNYHKVLKYCRKLGINEIYYYDFNTEGKKFDEHYEIILKSIQVSKLENHPLISESFLIVILFLILSYFVIIYFSIYSHISLTHLLTPNYAP